MRFSGKPMNGPSKKFTDIPPTPSVTVGTVSETSQPSTASDSATSSAPPPPPPPPPPALELKTHQENSF